jgi:hypothetical protein
LITSAIGRNRKSLESTGLLFPIGKYLLLAPFLSWRFNQEPSSPETTFPPYGALPDLQEKLQWQALRENSH